MLRRSVRILRTRHLIWIPALLLVSLVSIACSADISQPLMSLRPIAAISQRTTEPVSVVQTPDPPREPQVSLTYDEASTSLMAKAENFPSNAEVEFMLWIGVRPINVTFHCTTDSSGYCARPMGLIGDYPEATHSGRELVASAQSCDDKDLKAFSLPISFRSSSQGVKRCETTPTPSPTPTLTPMPTSTPTSSSTLLSASIDTPTEKTPPSATPSPTPALCVTCTLTPTSEPSPTPSPSITLVPTRVPADAHGSPHTATPTPIPLDSHFPYWRGEYFDNPQLRGEPELVQDDANLAFNWGENSPIPGALPKNQFSVRWSQRFVVPQEGRYTFYLDADDSAVVHLNGERLMSYHLNNQDDHVQMATRYLAQGEELHLEVTYVEHWADASLKFWWEVATEPPCWHGHYFANADLAGEVVAQEALCSRNIRKHWGDTDAWPPTLGPNTQFSTCWTRVIEAPMPHAEYRLCLYVRDSARLWLNRTLVLNKRSIDSEPQFICRDVTINPDTGIHVLRLDLYRKSQGNAVLGLYFIERKPNHPWTGAYFDNTTLSGPPTFVETAHELHMPSAKRSLDAQVRGRAFSSLWQREVTTNTGIYYFFARHDDGVLLTANNATMINDWYNGAVREQKHTYLATGKEALDLEVKYYHDHQGAEPKLNVWWEKATPTATVTPTPSMTPTPSPTFLPTHTPSPTP